MRHIENLHRMVRTVFPRHELVPTRFWPVQVEDFRLSQCEAEGIASWLLRARSTNRKRKTSFPTAGLMGSPDRVAEAL
jgi:hypothetical protein